MENLEKAPIYFIRMNFENQENIKCFFEANQIAIQVGTPQEIEDFNRLQKGEKISNRNSFLTRWKNLNEELAKNDVLVIAQFKHYKTTKLGIIRKNAISLEWSGNKEYKVFKLEEVKNLEYADYPIFMSIIPQQITISPIHQRVEYIKSIFSGKKPPFSIEAISTKQIELICLEWLRSDLAPKNYRLKYQMLLVGGNFAKIDIYGKTIDKKTIICQVSFTENEKTIQQKKENLRKFTNDSNTIKVLFCKHEDMDTNGDIVVFSLYKIWEQLASNDDYKEMLKALCNT